MAKGATKGQARPVYNDVLTFEPVNLSDIPTATRGESKTGNLLREFVTSGLEAAKVPVPAGRKVDSIRGNIDSYIKRHNLPVKVRSVGSELYLIYVEDEPEVEASATTNGEVADLDAAIQGEASLVG